MTIATTHEAKPLLTDKTIFWVVKPRLFAGNVSGLETLLSGSYIGMLPGATAGKPQHKFTGHEDPPILSRACSGARLLTEGQAPGLDLARLADFLPRPRASARCSAGTSPTWPIT